MLVHFSNQMSGGECELVIDRAVADVLLEFARTVNSRADSTQDTNSVALGVESFGTRLNYLYRVDHSPDCVQRQPLLIPQMHFQKYFLMNVIHSSAFLE